MKKLILTFLTIFSTLTFNVVWSADYEKGETAYQNGDYATALSELKPLANQGYDRAQFRLGWMYDMGYGVPEDDKHAVKLYTLAAEQGHDGAQFNLGWMYFNGEGVPELMNRFPIALKWYTLAAEQGHDGAQNNLAMMYANGLSGSVDYKTAVKWYTLAAEQGNAKSQYYLGMMYYEGEGVIQDNIYAHMWGDIATSNGNENGAKLTDIAARKMTYDDISALIFADTKNISRNILNCFFIVVYFEL